MRSFTTPAPLSVTPSVVGPVCPLGHPLERAFPRWDPGEMLLGVLLGVESRGAAPGGAPQGAAAQDRLQIRVLLASAFTLSISASKATSRSMRLGKKRKKTARFS